ncbi:PAS domain-containing sensor histidine kinase [Novosphingobium kaempferiae]|uniref:PAS domain-containing sensor histidine kinase n=1 Tax=Novosphingobium kaempferiae TaxID=2896849 RepID=UPI001E483A79|nr:ATP-binding protein [Novosphingobium kaempferiae]
MEQMAPYPRNSVDVEAITTDCEPMIAASSTEHRFDRLLEYMPIALWEVDARAPGVVFENLKAQGITDIVSYLHDHPGIVEQACDSVVVTRVNRAAARMFGAANDAELVQPVRYMFEATPQAAERVMAAHFDGRRNYVEEMQVKTFDGRIVEVLLLVTYPQPPENLDTTFITMQEIGDRVAAERQLRQLQTDFAHASRISTLGELSTSIAHEVKQPLGAIMLNGGTSLRRLAQVNPDLAKVRHLLEKIIESAGQATDIIGRIQAMASKQVPKRAQVSLNSIMRDAVRFVNQECVEKGITVRELLSPDVPLICGDRIQLQQVAVNLLVNAIHAIEQQSGGAIREICVLTHLTGTGRVEFVVADSGPGVAPENIGRLFDSFFTTKPGGMGIGLAICRTIMHDHDGEIAATNRPEGGSAFRCSLPGDGS